jgi:hypothetical protein
MMEATIVLLIFSLTIFNILNSKAFVSIRKGKKIKKMLTLFFYERL